MAAAAQHAPMNEPKKAAGGPREQAEKASAFARLPMAAGVAIMAALLVAALFVGNFRALQRVTPKAFVRQGEVASIVEDRLAAAGNAMTVARRAGLDEAVFAEIDNIINVMEAAKTARDISRADQALTAAVTQMVVDAGEKLDSENRTMLRSAADDFAEQGSFLRQEARSFNEQAEKAVELYEKLPTRFVLAEPDVYEGI